MASLSGLAVPEEVSEYTSWEACVGAVKDWSIRDKFHYKTPTSNQDRKTFVCATPPCKWKCLARKGRDGIIAMRVITGEHTCVADINRKRRVASTKGFLDEKVSQHLRVLKTTTPADVREVLALQYSEQISYHVAFECLTRLKHDDLGEQRYSFQLLPSYRDAVLAADPDAIIHLAIDPTTGKFPFYIATLLTTI